MWPANALTERLRLKWPIIQAPMGLMSTPALAAAVSNAGGLGGLGMWGLSAEDAGRGIAGFRQQSSGSLNVNYPMWPEPVTTAEVVEPMRQFLRSHYDANGLGGVPEPRGPSATSAPNTSRCSWKRNQRRSVSISACRNRRSFRRSKSAGIFVLSSATTVAEARLLEARGGRCSHCAGHRCSLHCNPHRRLRAFLQSCRGRCANRGPRDRKIAGGSARRRHARVLDGREVRPLAVGALGGPTGPRRPIRPALAHRVAEHVGAVGVDRRGDLLGRLATTTFAPVASVMTVSGVDSIVTIMSGFSWNGSSLWPSRLSVIMLVPPLSSD